MKYTPSHEWIQLNGSIATVGITDHAQQELGEVVYIELPKKGGRVKQGDVIVVLESTKAAVDLYSPLSGEILEVNPSLKEFPDKVNTSPEKEGWLFKIKISNPKEYEQYMDAASYKK